MNWKRLFFAAVVPHIHLDSLHGQFLNIQFKSSASSLQQHRDVRRYRLHVEDVCAFFLSGGFALRLIGAHRFAPSLGLLGWVMSAVVISVLS